MKHKQLVLTFNSNESDVALLNLKELTLSFEPDSGFTVANIVDAKSNDKTVSKSWETVERAIYDSYTNTISGAIGTNSDLKKDNLDTSTQWFFTIYLSLDNFRITVSSQGTNNYARGTPRGPGNGGGNISD